MVMECKVKSCLKSSYDIAKGVGLSVNAILALYVVTLAFRPTRVIPDVKKAPDTRLHWPTIESDDRIGLIESPWARHRH